MFTTLTNSWHQRTIDGDTTGRDRTCQLRLVRMKAPVFWNNHPLLPATSTLISMSQKLTIVKRS